MHFITFNSFDECAIKDILNTPPILPVKALSEKPGKVLTEKPKNQLAGSFSHIYVTKEFPYNSLTDRVNFGVSQVNGRKCCARWHPSPTSLDANATPLTL